MIIAGPCLFNDVSEEKNIIECAHELRGHITHFRCKVWGGGTSVEKYRSGMGAYGIDILSEINKKIPAGTEVQIPSQIKLCDGILNSLNFIWIGARNCQNYSLLKQAANFSGELMIKRHPGMILDEFINLYFIMKEIHKREVYLIERGIHNISGNGRWGINLNDIVFLKCHFPEIFDKLIIDCSHSVGDYELIKDTYQAMKAIGVKHYMFECTLDGYSKTDYQHMLSVGQLLNIINN
jgi:3-deoxy-7-phosphoheptulonate synthase